MLRTIGKQLFNLIPPDSSWVLKFAQRYLDRHNGENNSDSSSNGEEYLLRKVLPSMPGEVVFDVGANVGEWTKYALSVKPTLKMHLFEPSAATFSRLSQNPWPPNVKLNNLGLGEREEDLELHIVDPASGLNSLYVRHGVESAHITAKEKVRITTVDCYCEQHFIDRIHFMKVDVEGHELAVFRGMRRMLEEKRIDMLQFEYGGCNLDARVYLLDLWETLTVHGMQIAKIFPDGPRTIKTYRQELENFRYANYIAFLDKTVVIR